MLAFNIRPVKAVGTIYIMEDGSVDPPTAPIHRDGDVYTFTDDIYDSSVTVAKDNVVVDGAGYTLEITTASLDCLFKITRGGNVTVKNLRITTSGIPGVSPYSGNGIYIYSSSNKFYNNTISNTYSGITFIGSTENKVVGNIITYNSRGIDLSGSSGNVISNNKIAYNDGGIRLGSGNIISDNTVIGNSEGIFGSADATTISGNIIIHNDVGVDLGGSDNTLSGNIISSNSYGILLSYASNNTIFGNNIGNNERGVYVKSPTNNNVVYLNKITNNTYGAYLESSNRNKFYHNNFVGNTKQVYSYDSVDYWDDGYPSGGNYWSDYTGKDLNSGPNQDLSGSDGIGDTPYVIGGYIKDRYPLMKMKEIFEFPSSPILLLFMVLSVLAVVLAKRKLQRKPDT
jgi:parallel beta-helix repeat protein